MTGAPGSRKLLFILRGLGRERDLGVTCSPGAGPGSEGTLRFSQVQPGGPGPPASSSQVLTGLGVLGHFKFCDFSAASPESPSG